MYQITLGADRARKDWVGLLYLRLKTAIKDGVVVIAEENDRVSLGVAVKEKNDTDKVVFGILYDFFLKDVKGQYLYSTIKRYAVDEFLVQVYIKILKNFNTTDEKRILTEKLRMYRNFSLDGFYRFRLAPLREKWEELLTLTYNNIDLLKDESTFSLLIENLVSCLPIVTESAELDCNGDNYFLKFDNGTEFVTANADEVVYAIIDNLPKKLVLAHKASNNRICNRLKSVFGMEFVQII